MARNELEKYQHISVSDFAKQMRKKLGLEQDLSEDQQLVDELFSLMKDDYVDHTIFFRLLCDFDSTNSNNNSAIRDIFKQRELFDQWANRYQQRLENEQATDQQRMIKMIFQK